MATLTFQAGLVISTVTASDAKAAKAFRNAARLLGYDGDMGDNQAVADYVMAELRRVITAWSHQYQIDIDTRAARDAAESDQSIEFDL